jgi:hypothetical protein
MCGGGRVWTGSEKEGGHRLVCLVRGTGGSEG